MARKASVDVAQVLQMLQEGQSTQAVADRFGVSRQAIDLHRKRFIQNGKLADSRAARYVAAAQTPSSSASQTSVSHISGPPVTEGQSSKASPEVSLDKLIELVIEAFDSLRKLPKLETELEKYKQDYQQAAERLALLEQEAAKRKEQEARWQQAISPPAAPDAGHPPGYGDLSGWRNV